ncbi:MAG: NAD(P)H-dependent oxidoreductase subunit E, partial [Anaerolineae bacterium]
MLSDTAPTRLADVIAGLQPELDALFARYPDRRSTLMPILHMLQERFGHLSGPVLEEVAGLLDLDPTEVSSVASFYHLYFREPVGRWVLLLCEDIPCSLAGAEEMIRHVEGRLGVPCGEITEDGLFTAIRSPCLAACHR